MPETFVYLHMPRGRIARVGTVTLVATPGQHDGTVVFEYDSDYLASPDSYAISPDLPLRRGLQEPTPGRATFGAFADAAPEGWGRKLLQSAKNHRRRAAGLPAEKLGELEALLSVSDLTRQGALRFSAKEAGPFLAELEFDLPTTSHLKQLYAGAVKFDERGFVDDPVIRRLVAMGTSQGGARPKTAIIGDDGKLAIAKLPHPDDRHDVSRWEAVALALASRAGIATAPFRLHPISAWRAVLAVSRFDRGTGTQRFGYMSANTLVCHGRCRESNDAVDYEVLCDFQFEFSAAPDVDGSGLFRRIVFNLLIGNVDDHMRNHGFIRTNKGWRLAPMFGVNPEPAPHKMHATPVTPEDDPRNRDIRLLMKGADRYRLTAAQAKQIVAEVESATARWREVAQQIGLGFEAINQMSDTFDNANRDRARVIADSTIGENHHSQKAPDGTDSASVEWIPAHQRNGTTVGGYYRQRRQRPKPLGSSI